MGVTQENTSLAISKIEENLKIKSGNLQKYFKCNQLMTQKNCENPLTYPFPSTPFHFSPPLPQLSPPNLWLPQPPPYLQPPPLLLYSPAPPLPYVLSPPLSSPSPVSLSPTRMSSTPTLPLSPTPMPSPPILPSSPPLSSPSPLPVSPALSSPSPLPVSPALSSPSLLRLSPTPMPSPPTLPLSPPTSSPSPLPISPHLSSPPTLPLSHTPMPSPSSLPVSPPLFSPLPLPVSLPTKPSHTPLSVSPTRIFSPARITPSQTYNESNAVCKWDNKGSTCKKNPIGLINYLTSMNETFALIMRCQHANSEPLCNSLSQQTCVWKDDECRVSAKALIAQTNSCFNKHSSQQQATISSCNTQLQDISDNNDWIDQNIVGPASNCKQVIQLLNYFTSTTTTCRLMKESLMCSKSDLDCEIGTQNTNLGWQFMRDLRYIMAATPVNITLKLSYIEKELNIANSELQQYHRCDQLTQKKCGKSSSIFPSPPLPTPLPPLPPPPPLSSSPSPPALLYSPQPPSSSPLPPPLSSSLPPPTLHRSSPKVDYSQDCWQVDGKVFRDSSFAGTETTGCSSGYKSPEQNDQNDNSGSQYSPGEILAIVLLTIFQVLIPCCLCYQLVLCCKKRIEGSSRQISNQTSMNYNSTNTTQQHSEGRQNENQNQASFSQIQNQTRVNQDDLQVDSMLEQIFQYGNYNSTNTTLQHSEGPQNQNSGNNNQNVLDDAALPIQPTEQIINALPSIKFVSGEGGENASEQICAICLDALEQSEWGTILPCAHWFHKDCIEQWIKSKGRNVSCPLCNHPIQTSSSSSSS